MMEKRPPWLKVRYNEAAVWEVAELMRDQIGRAHV